MSWPLKYRPRQLEDLALEDVRAQLKKLLEGKNIPQVYLFAGPKGAGKTSTARIISSMLNDSLDKEEQDKIFSGNSFVVNEMDAASNRGIDDVRALKERVSLPPQIGSRAVYILDEAHMLTNEAFNALLKLLEEPPEHAVFILATTELHKIPETITSRANLVRFREANDQELKDVLSKILQAEKIQFEDEAVNHVVERSGGSFRDAVKLLETVARGSKKLTLAELEVLGSLTIKESLTALLDSVINKDEKSVVSIIESFRNNGEEEKYVYKSLLNLLHHDLMVSFGVAEGKALYNEKVTLFLLNSLQEVPAKENGVIPFLALEVALLELIFKAKEKNNSGSKPVNNVKKKPPEQTNELKVPQGIPEEMHDVVSVNNLTTSPLNDFHSDNLVKPDFDNYINLVEVWDDFISALENQNLTLAAILKSSKLIKQDTAVTKIGVFYKFHKMQLEQQRLHSILVSCGQEVSGGQPKFEFVLLSQSDRDSFDPQPVKPTQNEERKANTDLENDISEALL